MLKHSLLQRAVITLVFDNLQIRFFKKCIFYNTKQWAENMYFGAISFFIQVLDIVYLIIFQSKEKLTDVP